MSVESIRAAGEKQELEEAAQALAEQIAARIRARPDFGTLRGREADIAECLRLAAEDRDVWTIGEALLRIADAAYGAWALDARSGARYREQRAAVQARAQAFDLPGVASAYATLVQTIEERAAQRLGPLDAHTDGQSISLGDHFGIVFQRTLRIPDDGRAYPLPPGLGAFPVRRLDAYRDRLPPAWRDKKGFFIPLYQREALWLSFRAAGHRPVAVKIAIGRVSAISGAQARGGLTRSPQDYVVCPRQPWLDGIATGDGHIRQFVAMPLGEGYTVEGQITGQETEGGVQIEVYAPRPGTVLDHPHRPLHLPMSARARRRAWDEVLRQRYAPPPPVRPQSFDAMGFGGPMAPPAAAAPAMATGAMGLGAGGRMKQQIFTDDRPEGYWDTEPVGSFEVHLVNSEEFARITGEAPPPSPVSAQAYTAAGYPWFDYYDEEATAVLETEALRRVRSVRELDAQRGLPAGPEEDTVTLPDGQVIDLSAGAGANAADRAVELMREHRHADALRLLEALRRMHPGASTHVFNAALCLFHLGRYEEAREMQLAGPPSQWERPEVSHNLACIEAALGRPDAALRHALRAIQLDPGQREVLLADDDLAVIRARLRQLPPA